MKKIRFVRSALSALVIAAAILLPVSSLSATAEGSLKGMVTVVYDGDTVRVRLADRKDERVRLIGVDTPELDDAREQVRLMAFLAKRYTFSRLFQSTVELLPGPEKRDVYGRLLAYIRMADGEMFNETLVREGYAYAYLKFPFDEAWKTRLKDAESAARRSGKGLWQGEPYPASTSSKPTGRSSTRSSRSRSSSLSPVRSISPDGRSRRRAWSSFTRGAPRS
jgi:micrococcal nuclease